MSLRLVTNHPNQGSAAFAGSSVRVAAPGTEDAPADRVRIETSGPCDLNAREARMVASRLIRWSERRPKK
jgi:hypothetical protein